MATAADAVPLERATVIVVDDDPALLKSLKFALELEGFTVHAYADGQELLSEPTLPMLGCLVIDYNLPAGNGLELVRELRKRDVRLPAIIITSYPTRMLQEQAAACGISIVEKPLLNHSLSDAIRTALDQQGTRRGAPS